MLPIPRTMSYSFFFFFLNQLSVKALLFFETQVEFETEILVDPSSIFGSQWPLFPLDSWMPYCIPHKCCLLSLFPLVQIPMFHTRFQIPPRKETCPVPSHTAHRPSNVCSQRKPSVNVCEKEQWHSLSTYCHQRGIFKKLLCSTKLPDILLVFSKGQICWTPNHLRDRDIHVKIYKQVRLYQITTQFLF